MTLSFMPLGCSSARIHYHPSIPEDRPRIPKGTADRIRECVDELSGTIEPGYYSLDAAVKVDPDGHVLEVETTGQPNPDVGICVRIALRGMRLSGEIFDRDVLRTSASGSGRATPDRGQVGEVVTIVVVTVVFTEVIIEAFAITVAVAVTATATAGAAKRAKREKMCMPLLHECLGNKNHPNPDFGPEKDCGACYRYCMNEGSWPEDKCPRP
ncbi:hypothetical protein [Polyangium fumosum]|uniref:Uncharacterized protein n=1 Tax=Polyangium fumosum TaxID=889272 RepID=A0A4U1JIE6_9BACT|nr:hypothetical protein [Polyangium fumosum]TKD12431.1 hypothetical protein E8A74_04855 [Polyangium fumosum]